jgi:hypothetical protein
MIRCPQVSHPARRACGFARPFLAAVAIVHCQQRYFAAIDPALAVDHLPVGQFGLSLGAIAGRGTAIGHRLPDLDLGIAGARIVLLVTGKRAARRNKGEGSDTNSDDIRAHVHVLPTRCRPSGRLILDHGSVLWTCRRGNLEPFAAQFRSRVEPRCAVRNDRTQADHVHLNSARFLPFV